MEMSKITEATIEKESILPIVVCDRSREIKDLGQLLETISSGLESEAICMINDSRRNSIGMPNTKSLEMETDEDGSTALMWALFWERDAVVDTLVPISNLSAISHNNMSPIAYACLTGNLRHIKLICRYMDERGRNLFFNINSNGNSPLDYLLAHMSKGSAGKELGDEKC
jgi:hypothetical protein